MVRLRELIIFVIVGYLIAVIFIFLKINVQQNQSCGIPPIKGCMALSTPQVIVTPTTLPQASPTGFIETVDNNY